MNIKSALLAAAFAVSMELLTFVPASAIILVDASVTDVGIVITESEILGGGTYTVTNNSTGGLTGFGVSNPQSEAFIGSLGNTSGGQGMYFYESLTLNSDNWLFEIAFIDDIEGDLTFQQAFGDFTANVESGENTINWYSEADGALLPGQTATDFFLFGDGLLASIGLGVIGNGQTVFNNLAINNNVSAVPVPAALPLFGTGLAIMGFVGWRRKRKLAA